MRGLVLALATAAALGYALSIVAHVAAAFGALPFGGAVWGLHVGAIVLAVPSGFIARAEASGVPMNQFWKAALRSCPPWVKATALATFFYAIANFAIFALHTRGVRPTDAMAVRGFSGHWMAFFAMEFAVLVAFEARRHTAEQQR